MKTGLQVTEAECEQVDFRYAFYLAAAYDAWLTGISIDTDYFANLPGVRAQGIADSD